jgi:hypothetical protein
MTASTYIVTLAGPTVRSRPFAEHRDLTRAEADELRCVYLALGHDAKRITVTPSTVVEAA